MKPLTPGRKTADWYRDLLFANTDPGLKSAILDGAISASKGNVLHLGNVRDFLASLDSVDTAGNKILARQVGAARQELPAQTEGSRTTPETRPHSFPRSHLLAKANVERPSAADRQQAMRAGDRQRAVADREADALGRSRADVAGGQYAGQASSPAGTGRDPRGP